MRKSIFALNLVGTLAVAGLAGCASDDTTAHLSVQPAASSDKYVASFERALFAESDGRTDIVLLSGSAEPSAAAAPAADGVPTGVRQVVHLRVLWQPSRTIRVDSPSAGNAMVDWQVIADDDNRVAYAGSCWARVSVDGDEATVDVRQANVNVRQVVGNMNDPIKHAVLDGKFVAHRSDATVQAYVTDLANRGSRDATASAALPPARATAP